MDPVMRVDPTLIRQGSNPTTITKMNNIDGKDNRLNMAQ